MSGDTTVVVSDEFRADVERAIAVLRSEGAKEIYVFGSIVEPEAPRSPSDLDLAVSGLPPERFFHVHGVLLGELEHEFDLVELRAAATTLHAFYNGVERIFSIIAKYVDREDLTGRRRHRELLQRMTLPSENRNAVIETELADKLLDYLGFRHRFRHS